MFVTYECLPVRALVVGRRSLRGRSPQPAAQPQKPAGLSLSKPWWQKAGEWLQQKVVQPVQQYLTPQRVQQSLQPIFAPIGSSAQPSKKREKAPGWPRGKLRSPKQRYGMVKKTPVAAKTA